tara:strand:- start:14441 stop:14566 length:126 start_codon:yes stop_codon:yes gene_type:complete
MKFENLLIYENLSDFGLFHSVENIFSTVMLLFKNVASHDQN